MYNIYTYEKKKNFEETEKKKKKCEHLLDVKRKTKNTELVGNYERRVQKFIYDMVKSPVKISNYSQPIENTREQLLHEGLATNKKNKFVFNSFKTDRQRLSELVSQNKITEYKAKSSRNMKIDNKSENYQSKSENHRLETENREKNVPEVIQPHMKFKHRTELERIYDAINDYSFGRADREVIRKQLKSMNLYKLKRLIPKEEIIMYSHKKNLSRKYVTTGKLAQETSNFLKKKMEIIENLKEFMKKDETLLEEIGLDNKKNKRKYIDNSMSKYLMEDLHKKTHFKAVSMYLVNKNTSTIDSSILNSTRREKSSIGKLPNMTNKDAFTIDTARSNNNFFLSTQAPFISQSGSCMNIDPNKSIKRKSHRTIQDDDFNPVLSSLDFNPVQEYRNKEKSKLYDYDKLNYLKNISSTSRLTHYNPHVNFQLEDDEISAFINKKDEEEKIFIDNEAIPKSKVDVIAKKVLSKCNFLKKKSPHNDSNLQTGNGKLAMTCGMSISDFVNKFKIPK